MTDLLDAVQPEVTLIEEETQHIPLPAFDLHSVEEALLINHPIFNGQAMSREEVEVAVRQYREFLRDHKFAGMPDEFQVPSLVVDRVWHTHMCETQQYAEDCETYFGKMFHHSLATCSRRMIV